MKELAGNVITSMEVAQMVDKKHYDLLKDIRRYCEQLVEGKIPFNDFFTESRSEEHTSELQSQR